MTAKVVRRLLFFFCLAITVPPTAAGQVVPVPEVRPPAPTAPAAPRLDTLEKALAYVTWTEAQGPLLIVNPQGTRPFMRPPARAGEPYKAPARLEVPRSGQLTLRAVADYFGRKIVYWTGMTVLAPPEMTVFNAKPGKPDYFATLDREQRAQIFVASLDARQWQELGSPQGLGVGDLLPDQQKLFLALLPDPLMFQKLTTLQNGYRAPRPDETNGMVKFPGLQRAQVRLQVSRGVGFLVPMANRDRSYIMVNTRGGFGRKLPEGTGFWQVTAMYASEQRNEAYGQVLRQEVPNRLKPGDIDYDAPALRAMISLAAAPSPPEGGKPETLTVGELVRRAGAAARAELYADARVARLPVLVPGAKQARARDVLKALCYAVTGTFR